MFFEFFKIIYIKKIPFNYCFSLDLYCYYLINLYKFMTRKALVIVCKPLIWFCRQTQRPLAWKWDHWPIYLKMINCTTILGSLSKLNSVCFLFFFIVLFDPFSALYYPFDNNKKKGWVVNKITIRSTKYLFKKNNVWR